jgi:hypothetical protein
MSESLGSTLRMLANSMVGGTAPRDGGNQVAGEVLVEGNPEGHAASRIS